MAKNSPVEINRSQRVLAFMIAGIILLSVISIFVTLGLTAAGVNMTEGIFPTIVALPAIGLPLGFALVVVLLVLSVVQRGRAAKDARN